MTRRVVVTGMSGITGLGNDWDSIRAAMARGETAIRRMPDWDFYTGLNTRLAGPVPNFDLLPIYGRKKLRSMGRVAQMAVRAADVALEVAGLRHDREFLKSGRVGVACGSSFGSTPPVIGFARLMTEGTARGLTATSYIHMMSHTAAVNIGIFFGLTGRVIPTSTACTSGSMGVGYAFEAIRSGQQDVMVAGGAEELCPTMSAVFDTLFATSSREDAPDQVPRPFDRDRDGLVIGEGAGVLILEALDRAQARGAPIFAEIVGFATNSDGAHITQPTEETMCATLRMALEDAGLPPDAIDIVNAHGTATEIGDIAESAVTRKTFRRAVAVHTQKGHFGHTLGACGAIEAWLAIEMMRSGWFPPTANLENVDAGCAELDYVMETPLELEAEYVMSNNFAFGGINTSLIIKAYPG